METNEAPRELADVLDGLRVAMVATPTAGSWQSRPLVLADLEGIRLRFLVSAKAAWVQALERAGAPAGVTFSDPGKNTHLALAGTARAVDDRVMVSRVWTSGAGAYFEGRDDLDIRVLEFDVSHGEWWDGPSGHLGRAITLAGAASGHPVGHQGPIAT